MNYTDGNIVYTITTEGNNIWTGTEGGLVKLNRVTGEKSFLNKANSGLPGNFIGFITQDEGGNKWIGTDMGLAKFDGTNWTVCPLISAHQFIRDIAFPYTHPNARKVSVVESKNLTNVAQNYRQRMRALVPMIDLSYDAAIITLIYTENSVDYIEKMICIIENWGQAGAEMWGNKKTFYIRTPENEFAKYEPVMSIIQNSVIINKQWLAGELNGQQQRGEIMINT